MTKWYSIKEIDENIFALGEDKHWEHARSYLFRGKDVTWLIDSGTGIGDLLSVINKLTDTKIKVITTHVHWDHIGHHDKFQDLFVHKNDALWLLKGFPIPANIIYEQVFKKPFDIPMGSKFNKTSTYLHPKVKGPHLISDGDILESSDFKFLVIHTPGHSPGSICLLEKNRKLLITGDLVYRGIIFANYESTNPKSIHESYLKISRINAFNYILPGHNDSILDRSIIDEGLYTLQNLNKSDLIKHGSGKHKNVNISFLF